MIASSIVKSFRYRFNGIGEFDHSSTSSISKNVQSRLQPPDGKVRRSCRIKSRNRNKIDRAWNKRSIRDISDVKLANPGDSLVPNPRTTAPG